MNKQDRQNKKIIERERERNSSCLWPRSSPLPMWLLEKVLGGAEVGAAQALMHHTSWAQKRSEGMPRAGGKPTSEFCILSLLDAGLTFSEQSWVLGRQTARLTEAPRWGSGVAGTPADLRTHPCQPLVAFNPYFSLAASFRTCGHYTAAT